LKAHVYVTLRDGVLDAAGKAVLGGLHSMDYGEVASVRLGRFIEVELSDAMDSEAAKARLGEMCERLLANTVIEQYRIELVEE
jgi:phosphoribosylformylglycinamidine synthase PurS subunit